MIEDQYTSIIWLTQNKYTIVDNEDYEQLNRWKWGVAGRIKYAKHSWQGINRNHICHIYMHRLILNVPEGLFTDHVNRNSLDNRKSNLRICTTQENAYNKNCYKNNTSGHKGVSYYKRKSQWTARISVNKQSIFLGYFDNLDDAVIAYKNAAMQYHGSFASKSLIG